MNPSKSTSQRRMRIMGIVAVVLCAVSLTAVSLTCLGAEATPAKSASETPVAQLLGYRGDELINQGTAVLVNDTGTFITSADLVRGSDRVMIDVGTGEARPANVKKTLPELDLAVLEVTDRDIPGLSPVTIAAAESAQGDALKVVGFWSEGLEPKRRFSVFKSSVPAFVAARQSPSRTASAVLQQADDDALVLVVLLGRGAYGAPVLNKCQQLAGLIRTGKDKTPASLWQPHTLAPTASAIARQKLISALTAEQIAFKQAQEVCGAAPSAASDALKKQVDDEKEQREKAEQRARKAQAEAKKAQTEAQQAEAEKQRTKKDADEQRQETGKTLNDVAREAERQKDALEQERTSSQQLVIYGAGAIALLCAVAIGIGIKRRRDVAHLGSALAKEQARFHDCLLQGIGSEGRPIAVKISGIDLMRAPDGLVIGRNPDLAAVVIADELVSRRHARLRVSNGLLTVEDVGSTGGTHVNDMEALAGRPLALSHNDILKLSTISLTVQFLGE